MGHFGGIGMGQFFGNEHQTCLNSDHKIFWINKHGKFWSDDPETFWIYKHGTR